MLNLKGILSFLLSVNIVHELQISITAMYFDSFLLVPRLS